MAALFRLAGAGVRVPQPYDFLEDVLLMELVDDEYGNAAPRLNDVVLEPDEAREYHAFLISQIVRSLRNVGSIRNRSFCENLHE